MPQQGAVIDEYFVPAGVVVSVAQWAASRASQHFHKPNEFCPERWLQQQRSDSEFAGDCLDASQPFSVGARSCIGKNVADLEARLVIVGLIRTFDVKLRNDEHCAKLNRQWTLCPTAGSVKAYQSIRRMDLWVDLVERPENI